MKFGMMINQTMLNKCFAQYFAQVHIVKNTLLPTVFSAILPTRKVNNISSFKC